MVILTLVTLTMIEGALTEEIPLRTLSGPLRRAPASGPLRRSCIGEGAVLCIGAWQQLGSLLRRPRGRRCRSARICIGGSWLPPAPRGSWSSPDT